MTDLEIVKALATAFLFAAAFGLFATLNLLGMLRRSHEREDVVRKLNAELMSHDCGPVLEALIEQCGQGWVDASLKDFTLAATVTRAIRWHKDTVSELRESKKWDDYYRTKLESVAIRHYNDTRSGPVNPEDRGELRAYVEENEELPECD